MCLAVPGRVMAVEQEGPDIRVARVDFAGIEKQVNLSLVPEAQVGDFVLVHVGVAIARVDAQEARKVFEYLEEIDAVAQELGP
ncbi:MAG TPA: HypC/HybG/HupF family hydrogenase formation chaperone [Vicinamibacteria bacterium]|nr:HypC/HybG/HupF family hydrogenase formation chaperone [Vicinamibacteria bacterium]